MRTKEEIQKFPILALDCGSPCMALFLQKAVIPGEFDPKLFTCSPVRRSCLVWSTGASLGTCSLLGTEKKVSAGFEGVLGGRDRGSPKAACPDRGLDGTQLLSHGSA